MDGALSKSERETLKAVFRLAKDGEGAHTGELAAHLGVSPGTATATVKRLAGRGLLDHRPYRGVELTEAGRREAAAAMRRHRIVERFLSDMLGYAWNEADRLAGSFEHELPQEVEDRLFVALDRPSTCPHGFPIPEPETGDMPDMPPIYELEAGDVAVVAISGGFYVVRGELAAVQGTPQMREVAAAIQEGAMAYLRRQCRTSAMIVVPLAVLVFFTSTHVLKPGGGEALSFVQSGTFRTLA